jgi:putative transposase
MRNESIGSIPKTGATAPNQRWSMDFMGERVADGRWFRILTVVDQFRRECLCWWLISRSPERRWRRRESRW